MSILKKTLSLVLSMVCTTSFLFSGTGSLIANAETYGDYEYSIANNEVVITNYTGTAESVNIPAEIDGLPVVEIGTFVFALTDENGSTTGPNTTLKNVTIPEGIITISKGAFYYCTNLESLTIPESVGNIATHAFCGCSSLESLTIKNSECTIFDSDYTISTKAKIYGYEGSTAEAYATKYLRTFEALAEEAPDGLEYEAFDSDEDEINDSVKITNYTGSAESVNIPAEIDGLPVVGIDREAFSKNESIESVIIPDSVTTIGVLAFWGCINLKSVKLSENLITINDTAFAACINLSNITIPNKVKVIGSSVFNSCTGLASVTLPEGLESIGNFAFRKCVSIEHLTIPANVESLEKDVFDSCTGLTRLTIKNPECIIYDSENVIPDSATIYGYKGSTAEAYATKYSRDFEALIAGLEYAAFDSDGDGTDDSIRITKYTGSATDLEIPETIDGLSVVEIGAEAFKDCKTLVNVTIPDSVMTIGASAFKNCTNLFSVIIPDGITIIDEYVFQNCESLERVEIPAGVISIGTGAFMSCTNLGSVTLPDGLKSIGYFGFRNCKAIDSLTLTENVVLEPCTFMGCIGLTSLTIEDGVEGLSSSSFSGCTGLTSVILPESIESLGDGAFEGCTGLISLTIKNAKCRIDDSEKTISATATIYGYEGSTAEAYATKYSRTFVALEPPVTTTIPVTTTETVETTIVTTTEEIPAGLEYEAFDSDGDGTDDSIRITKYIGSATSVNIPAKIDELPVVEIGTFAFAITNQLGIITGPNTTLKNVTIPEGVITISMGAFYGCTSLESVTIPASVENIGEEAFSSCSSLESITIKNPECIIADDYETISDSATIYGYVNSTAHKYASEYGRDFEALTPPVTTIPVTTTETVETTIVTTTEEIPDGLEYEAFDSDGDGTDDCIKITNYTGDATSVNIPAKIDGLPVVEIGEYAFALTDENGNAIGANTTLKNVTIPEGVITISKCAFFYCTSLESVTIPVSVENIGEEAFSYCSSLESITIKNPDCIIADDYETISDSATIYGYANSTAHKYASEYGRDFEALTPPVTTIPVTTTETVETTIVTTIIPVTSAEETTTIAVTTTAPVTTTIPVTTAAPITTTKPVTTTVVTTTKAVTTTIPVTTTVVTTSKAVTTTIPVTTTVVTTTKGVTTTVPVTTTVVTTTKAVTTTVPVTTTVVTTTKAVTTTVPVTTTTTIPVTTTVPVTTTAPVTTQQPLKGDVSHSGHLDLYDVIMIAQHMLKKITFTAEDLEIADFDCNGKVDLYDAIGIAKELVKIKMES